MNVLEGINLGFGRRLPMLLQTEAAECGLACLAMIASFFGYQTDLAHLRRRYGLSLRGATLKDLMRIADCLGMASRPLRIEIGELALLRLPCILHWDLNHFVVLKSVSSSAIVVHDPGFGTRRMTFSEVSKHFTGVALELTPSGGFERSEPPPRIRVRALLGRLIGIKRALAQLLGLALALEVFAMVSPLLMQWVVDQALVTADQDLLVTLAIGMALMLLIRTAVGAIRSWMLMVLSTSMHVQARANLFSHLINVPAAYFETRHLADIMSRFNSQDTILQTITTEMVEAVLDGLMASITLVVMFIYSPALTFLVLLGAVFYGLLRWAMFTPLRLASLEAIVWGARQDSHFLETLRGIKAIKLFNGQEARRTYWLNLLVESVNRHLTMEKLGLLFRTANALLMGSLGVLVIWTGAQKVLDTTFSVGMLFAFIAYMDQFLGRISALIDRIVDLQMLGLHGERLADIALTTPEPRDDPAAPVGKRGPAAIEVRNLRFRYSENDPSVLDGLDFAIAPGESVAIVGSSGCGKTTLLKILASLLQPTQGEILVNGEPLSRLGRERYRELIGVVMQDDQLFAGSLAENISFFSERPDQERIEECARLAAVHDDILAMPMGYGTLMGDMGTVLSGGQKQRVLIARALYRQPGILLLDEATSHLDVAREKAVNEAVRTMALTRIIVAHRPETIRSSERVIVLDRGKVVEDRSTALDDSVASRPSAELSDLSGRLQAHPAL